MKIDPESEFFVCRKSLPLLRGHGQVQAPQVGGNQAVRLQRAAQPAGEDECTQ